MAFIIALVFHAANETVLALRIGWFSYYMIALAGIYFLPEPFLWRLGSVLTWPARKLAYNNGQRLEIWSNQRPRLATAMILLGAVLASALMVTMGLTIDLPGAWPMALVLAFALSCCSLISLFRGSFRAALKYVCGAGVVTGVMWVVLAQSTIRFDYYSRAASLMKARGNLEGAATAEEKALAYLPRGKKPAEKSQGGIFDGDDPGW